jgi:hypothetical protein
MDPQGVSLLDARTQVAEETWPVVCEDSGGWMSNGAGFACNMGAMTPEERGRYGVLREKLETSVCGVVEFENGYLLRFFSGMISMEEMGEWVELEEKCCPFFGLGVETGVGEGAIGLRITGGEGIKEFIRAEFAGVKFG